MGIPGNLRREPSPSVTASSPIITKTAAMGSMLVVPVRRSRTSIAVSELSPCSRAICELVRTLIAALAPIWSINQRDMRASDEGPRTSMVAERACQGKRSPPALPSFLHRRCRCPAPLCQRCITACRTVVETTAQEAFGPRQVQCAPGRSGGNDQCPGAQPVSPVEDGLAGGHVDAHDGSGDNDFGAEPLGLDQRPAGQVVPGDPVRETRVVFDACGGSRLASGCQASRMGGSA